MRIIGAGKLPKMARDFDPFAIVDLITSVLFAGAAAIALWDISKIQASIKKIKEMNRDLHGLQSSSIDKSKAMRALQILEEAEARKEKHKV